MYVTLYNYIIGLEHQLVYKVKWQPLITSMYQIYESDIHNVRYANVRAVVCAVDLTSCTLSYYA